MSIADNFDGLNRRDELLTKCEEVEKLHLDAHNVNDEEYEGRLYKLIN